MGECKCENVGVSYHAHPFEKSHDGKLRRKGEGRKEGRKEGREKGDGEGRWRKCGEVVAGRVLECE